MSFVNRRHQSNVANGSSSTRQPALVSIYALPGWLMQTSVISLRESNGRRNLRFNSSADASARAPRIVATSEAGFKFIDRPEVQIPRHQHLNAIALLFVHRGRYIHRAFQHFGGDVLSAGRI